MVAAKLDHSRVLVTTFRQNRSTLKSRSAGQRQARTHTHRQTNSAENKGPSGLQSGQQTTTIYNYITSLAEVTRNRKHRTQLKQNRPDGHIPNFKFLGGDGREGKKRGAKGMEREKEKEE